MQIEMFLLPGAVYHSLGLLHELYLRCKSGDKLHIPEALQQS